MENNVIANKEKGRCVCAAPVAKELVRKGYAVIDIKPNRVNHNKSVFVFRETENFDTDFKDVLNAYNSKKKRKRLNKIAYDTFVGNKITNVGVKDGVNG